MLILLQRCTTMKYIMLRMYTTMEYMHSYKLFVKLNIFSDKIFEIRCTYKKPYLCTKNLNKLFVRRYNPMYVCMHVCLSVPYIVLCVYVCSSVDEQSHYLRATIPSSCYQGSRTILLETHIIHTSSNLPD